jgi:hypothetical protein
VKALRLLLTDFPRVFYAPRALYREISAGRPSPSWVAVLAYCLLYVGGALWLYFNGFEPFNPPWLVLDPQRYYLVEAFYILPVIFLVWILGAGLIRVLGRLAGGQGRFEVLLRMTGYALWAPWYALFIVDVIHATPEWLYMTVLVACMAWILVGLTVAVAVEERIGPFRAALIALVTVGAVGIVTYTYIR